MSIDQLHSNQMLENGQVVAGRYLISSCVGFGGMGAVYICRDIELDLFPIALKVLWGKFDEQPVVRERFRREVVCCHTVSHANIVRAFDFVQDENLVGYTMEYIDGTSLDRLIERGPIGIEKAENLILQISRGLDAIHKAQIVHRDIKPENILLDKDGVVKIADFGIARLPNREKLTRGELVGSIECVCPEYLLNKEVTYLSDVYALGVLSYKILSGESPFVNTSIIPLIEEKVDFKPKPVDSLVPLCPKYLSNLICSMMAAEPIDRVQSAQQVENAIIVKSFSPQKTSYKPKQKPKPDSGSNFQSALLLGTLLAVCLLFFFLNLRSLREEFTSVVIEELRNSQKEKRLNLPKSINASTSVAEGGKKESAVQKKVQRVTTLRIVSKPVLSWARHGPTLKLTKIIAKIKNVGSFTADEVEVDAVLSDGRVFKLDGPTAILRNKSVFFEKKLDEHIAGSEKVELEIYCDNCRKRKSRTPNG